MTAEQAFNQLSAAVVRLQQDIDKMRLCDSIYRSLLLTLWKSASARDRNLKQALDDSVEQLRDVFSDFDQNLPEVQAILAALDTFMSGKDAPLREKLTVIQGGAGEGGADV